MIAGTARRLAHRYLALGGRVRVLGTLVAIIAAYALFYVAPGTGPALARRAPVGIVLVGVIVGSVTSLLAMGLILIYRANRFINFAYGSMGSLVGVLAIGMYKEHGWPFFLALPVGVVAGVVVGGLVEFLVVRRFWNTSRLIVTVASIGLAQVLGFIELRGTKAIGFLSLTGGFKVPISWSFNVGVRELAGDEILIIATVPVVILGLAWFLLKTDAGVAVRAAAENSDRALLYGIPIRRLSTIVWAIAGGLSALTFLLRAPFAGVTPGLANGPTVLLPGLAAAVVARMESLPMAFGAGVSLGIIEQLVLWNSKKPSLTDMIFLGVILLALLVQRGRLSRGAESASSSWSSTGIVKPIPLELRRVPEVLGVKLLLVAGVVAAFILVPKGWSPSNQYLAAIAVVWAMVGVSLVVLTGWGGHISLGQFAIAGIGAFTAGNLVQRYNPDLFLALFAAGAAGAVAALLVGLPALRIRGPFLAVTTLALAVAVNSYLLNINNFPTLVPQDVPRGYLWERFDLAGNYAMYLLCLAFLGLSMLAAIGVRKARSGRVVIATRDNQRASDAAAVPTTNVKLSAFVLAGVIAGIAGGLHVLLISSLQVGTYNPGMSLEVFATAVIGGLGSLGGAVMGVLFFQYLQTVHSLGELRLAVTGAGLLFVLYFLPGGIWQVVVGVRDRLLRLVADRRGILVPSLVADKRVETEDAPSDELDLLRGALSDESVGSTV